jgi:hypothetical protein
VPSAAIEDRDTGQIDRFACRPGLGRTPDRNHRGVNVGKVLYEEITVFFLDRP